MADLIIREIKSTEFYLLEDFLYESIFQRDGNELLPRSVIEQPELKVYIDDFGKLDDHCLVAECDGKIVGAVWTRILCGEIKGYGYIDSKTPEFAISVRKEYRHKGIGTALMKAQLKLLRRKGYKRASLSVQKDNYAVKLYKAVGFEVVDEHGEELLMVCEL